MPITRIPQGRVQTLGDVTPDPLLGQPSVALSNSSGVSGQEFYLVTEIKGVTALQRLHSATRLPGIPTLGTLHPLLNVPVASVRARFIGENFTTEALVEVNYGLVQGGGGFENEPDDVNAQPQLEILSTLQPVSTVFDVNGAVLVIDNYVRIIRDEAGEPIGSEPQANQLGEVEVAKDFVTIIARRRERISPGASKAPNFTNTINQEPVFGDLRAMWKCVIGGTTDDGGDTWNVVYEFQRNHPDSWHTVIVWHDPETGLPGADVTRPLLPTSPGSTGNGSKVVQMYPLRNFRQLQLPIFG